MLTRSLSTRILIILATGGVTVLHQVVTLAKWPLRSPVGNLLMSFPPAAIGVAAIALLVISALATKQRGSEGPPAMFNILAGAALGALVIGALYIWHLVPESLTQFLSTSPLAATVYTLGIALGVAIFTALRARRVVADKTVREPWRATEILLCTMFALNMLLIALPEIRFVSGFVSPQQVPSGASWPSFRLFYSDVLKMDFNPLFAGMRAVLAYYTPEYFLTQMACVYLMAIAIAFFCAGLAPIVGYYGGLALAAGLCWSKIVLLVVFTGTNVVTLFFAAGLAIWVLSETYRIATPGVKSPAILLNGFLIGLVGTASLYAYAPSRFPCFLFLGASCALLAWRGLRSSTQRRYYLGALLAALLVPATLVFGQYRGDWSSFSSEFRASVLPSVSNVHAGRPAFIDPTLEASTPDLPGYYGAMIAEAPQPDGSKVSGWVYWRRSPQEFAWVFWNNLERIIAKQFPFPGGKVAWFFVVVGLAGSIAIFSSRLKATLYAVGVCCYSLGLLAPFLIVLSPAEWRRGAAVVLVFSSLAGLGVHVAVRLCFPKIREAVAVLVSSILIFVVFARPAVDAIAATSADEVAIAMVCPFNPLAPLFSAVRKEPRMTGKVLIVGSPQDRCKYSASRHLDTLLGAGRVQLINLPAPTLEEMRTLLKAGDSVAVHCGRAIGDNVRKFCDELRQSPEATLVYSAPADGNELWVFTAR